MRAWKSVTAAAVLGMVIQGAWATSTLVGTFGSGGAPSTLVEINPLTGAVTTIGSVGYSVNGMDCFDGRLYATTPWHDPSHHGLIEINMVTGAGTPIGSGWGGAMTAQTVVEMAIDSTGRAFAWGEPGEDDLYEINLTTGTASRVGESGLDTAMLGLAFDLADDLYLHHWDGGLHRINPATGSSAFLGSTGTTAHHGDVDPDTGLYYGLSQTSLPEDLVTINLSTRVEVARVQLPDYIHTLAFKCDEEYVIPEPLTLAGIALGVGCLDGYIRRRRAA